MFASSIALLTLLGCDESDITRNLAAAFKNAEAPTCQTAGQLMWKKQGDPALGFYFTSYCWPEATPWSECIPFKKGFLWGPPPSDCFAEVEPHLACLTDLESEEVCSARHPVSFRCNPLVGDGPVDTPQDCYCQTPSFFADYQGSDTVQEFRERQSHCGPGDESYELHCSVLDDACGTTCECYQEGAKVDEVYLPAVHDMTFRARAWRACGFPDASCTATN